jgi:glycerate kinase
MNILIAPNAFKNSLAADRAAEAIRDGLLQSDLPCACRLFPVGDGGDGTAGLISSQCDGTAIQAETTDPFGRSIQAPIYLIDGGRTAVIEMADASGLRLLASDELDPLRASSFGTGQMMLRAVDLGVTKIILCVGGSATVDGGAGLLAALGFEFRDKSGRKLTVAPSNLAALDTISAKGVDTRLQAIQLAILCDVENPLLGEQGAAPVFGPQKGANSSMVSQLEAGLTALRDAIMRLNDKDVASIRHGGAAGGVGASLFGLLHADLVNGIDYFLSLTKFEEALNDADLMITGEGSIDLQTLKGKGPIGVAKMAKQQGKGVVGFAGAVPSPVPDALQAYFDHLISINPPGLPLADAMRNTHAHLIKCAEQLGNDIAGGRLFSLSRARG